MSNSKQSRRNFLQNASLLGVGLPLASFNGLDFAEEKSVKFESGKQKDGTDQTEFYIKPTSKGFDIKAGNFLRKIELTGGNLKSTGLQVAGKEVLSAVSNDFSLTFHAAHPNKRPAGLVINESGKTEWANGLAANAAADNQPVEWSELATINGENCSSFFSLVRKKVESFQTGVTKLHVCFQSFANNGLKDVAIHVYYEIYQDHPAIRKWMEVVNNSTQWIKIDQLVIDDIHLSADFTTTTPLTPEEKGAESCIVAFSNQDRSSGVIAASEIPSAIRRITKEGAMGYAPEYFEWVLGPSESFITEPVFYFAFDGENVKTISGVSTALDRAVEAPFKDFLRKAVGLRGNASLVPAPIWCSYTNFLVDLTDANMREQADIAAKIGFVTFQLDEGWAQTPSPGGSEPGSTFPNFEATCDYIRSKGMQLGLWISCFRGLDSKDISAIPDGRSLPLFTNTKRGYGMSFSGPWKDYFANDLVYMRNKYGMTYVKEDLTNISKGDIANSHESRTKKESLLRGLRGLLQVNKRIGELAPDIWTQVTHEIYWKTPGPPADIAVLKYACAFHTTPNTYLGSGNGSKRVSPDWNIDPVKMRAQLIESCWQSRQRFYSHRGLPSYSVEFYAAHAVNIKGSLTTAVQDRQVCSWLMGAPTVFAGDLSSLSEENVQHYRKRFDLLKRLQATYNIYRFFQFSGVPEPTDTGWHWWGKLDQKGAGAVVVIRGSEGGDARQINIPWVRDEKRYQLTALFSNKELGKFTGAQLRKGELHLSLPVYGQEIIEVTLLS